MKIGRSAWVFWLLVDAAGRLSAANYVFVFHGGQPTASVYDADTLQLVATPAVGSGARRAFGVPDPSNPAQFLKLYVVTNNSVVVLNPQPPFEARTTLPLGAAVPADSPNPAVLSPDGRRLLVAAGDTVHVLNTRDPVDALNVSIPLPFNPFGIVVTPNSKRAYVMSNETTVVRILELDPFVQLLSLTAPLPPGNLPMAIGMAPNGSRLYVTAPGQLYDVDRVSNFPGAAISNPFTQGAAIVFDPDPPVATAVLNAVGGQAPVVNLATRSIGVNPLSVIPAVNISRVVLPGSNRAYVLAGSPGRLFQGFLSAGGPMTEVTLPEFGTGAVDIEGSPDGRWIFAAFSSGRLTRFDPNGAAAPAQASIPLAPSGLSLVYAASTGVSTIEIYGGNNQTGAAGTRLPAPLAVRVRGGNNMPAYNQTVSFSTSGGATIEESSVSTNLSGVAETFVNVNVATAVEVTASVIAGGSTLTRTFTLNGSGSPSGADGLQKVAGDRQLVVQGNAFPFPLVVRATAAGVPVPNVIVSVIAPGSVTCPSAVLTNQNGEASFQCAANAASSPSTAEIQMTDPAGRLLSEPFRVQIAVFTADLPAEMEIESESNLVATVRETRSNAIRVRARKANGEGASEVGISLTAPPDFDITFDPRVPVTTSGGSASASILFGCRAGSGAIRVLLLSQNQIQRNINFTVTPGPAAQMIKRQGDGQSGNPGQRLDGPGQALLVRLADQCGNGIRAQRVEWQVTPPEAATLENTFLVTNEAGEASTLVRLGNRPGPFTVTATSLGFSAAFNLSVNIVARRMVAVSGNNQSVPLGQAAAQQLVIEAQDASGVPAPGVEVAFRVTTGSAAVDPARAVTNAQGRASTTVRAGNVLGPITVVAEGAGQNVTFQLTAVGRVPVVTAAGFVNGASFRPGWVPGSTGSIFGRGLMEGITGAAAADRAPFPTILRGVRVTVEGVDAPLISLVNQDGQEQINLQVPFNIPAAGTVTVVIENNGSRATVTGVPVLPVMPGIFEFPLAGGRYAAALHADFTVVTPENPARRGEIILLFLTGLGATNPPVGTNVPGPVPPAVTVRQPVVGLNGEGMEVLGSFYAPGLYSAYQINFRVGPNVRSGLASLSVVVDGVASQDSRLPVQ